MIDGNALSSTNIKMTTVDKRKMVKIVTAIKKEKQYIHHRYIYDYYYYYS